MGFILDSMLGFSWVRFRFYWGFSLVVFGFDLGSIVGSIWVLFGSDLDLTWARFVFNVGFMCFVFRLYCGFEFRFSVFDFEFLLASMLGSIGV